MTALSHLFRWALAWSQERCAHRWVHREWICCECHGRPLHPTLRCERCGVVACVLEDID